MSTRDEYGISLMPWNPKIVGKCRNIGPTKNKMNRKKRIHRKEKNKNECIEKNRIQTNIEQKNIIQIK